MQYIDLTHTFRNNIPAYPGDPTPELVQTTFLEKGGYNEFQLKAGMHVGTHIDAPLHMIEGGKKISEYPPAHFFGRGVLVDARGKKQIDEDLLNEVKIIQGDIVLILTGFYKKFGDQKYYEVYSEIMEAFAQKIIKLGVKIIGMDMPSPDRAPFAIHKLLLSHDVLIIENLTNLEELLEYPRFDIVALPTKFDAEAAPVRIIAIT